MGLAECDDCSLCLRCSLRKLLDSNLYGGLMLVQLVVCRSHDLSLGSSDGGCLGDGALDGGCLGGGSLDGFLRGVGRGVETSGDTSIDGASSDGRRSSDRGSRCWTGARDGH